MDRCAFAIHLSPFTRPIYYSICPHTPTPTTGTAAEFSGTLSYAPPPSWTADQRHALANSILVEYTNTFDEWYDANPPRRPHWWLLLQ